MQDQGFASSKVDLSNSNMGQSNFKPYFWKKSFYTGISKSDSETFAGIKGFDLNSVSQTLDFGYYEETNFNYDFTKKPAIFYIITGSKNGNV